MIEQDDPGRRREGRRHRNPGGLAAAKAMRKQDGSRAAPGDAHVGPLKGGPPENSWFGSGYQAVRPHETLAEAWRCLGQEELSMDDADHREKHPELHDEAGRLHNGVPHGVTEGESKGLPNSDREKTESRPTHSPGAEE